MLNGGADPVKTLIAGIRQAYAHYVFTPFLSTRFFMGSCDYPFHRIDRNNRIPFHCDRNRSLLVRKNTSYSQLLQKLIGAYLIVSITKYFRVTAC